MRGVYVHIPYCRTICPYCDFVKRPTPEAAPTEFVDALCREIGAYEGPREADAVFFGGGTPSLLALADMERILGALHDAFDLRDPEITAEANPDDMSDELAAAWRAMGINRVSLGVQSFDEDALRYLGRRHDVAGAHRACEIVARHFDTWNLDLMFGAHPVGTWELSLRETLAHRPHHVSAYGLTYEAGTPFGKRGHEAIDDETYLTLYRETLDAFGAAGIARYEVSNFARLGHECRHNLIYWRNEEYAGFGTAAYSYLNGVRARNHVKIDDYLADPGGKCEALILDDREIRVETVIQYLRLAEGLPKATYRERFGADAMDDFAAPLRDCLDRGLIADTGDVLQPTALGFELNNEIGLALVG